MAFFDFHRPVSNEGVGEESVSYYRAIFDRAAYAQLIFDDTGCVTVANPAAVELLGLDAAAIAGQRLDRFIALPEPENLAPTAVAGAPRLAPGHRFRECTVLGADGRRRKAGCRIALHIVPGFHLCQMEDLSSRLQIEESYRTLVELTHTGYAILDPAGRVIDANPEYVRLSGHAAREQIVGRAAMEWTAPGDRARSTALLAECAAGTPIRNLEIDYGAGEEIRPVELNASAIETPEGIRVLMLCRDIASRRQAEQHLQVAHEALEDRVNERTADLARAQAQLRERALRQETVAQFGQRALMGASAGALMREAVELIGRTLRADLCEVIELLPSGESSPREGLLLRALYGWPAEWLDRRVAGPGAETLEDCVLRAKAPVAFADLGAETRFHAPDRLREVGVVSGLSLVINGETRPFGFLGVHSRERRAFSADEVCFVQSMANVLAEGIERQRAEEVIRLAQHQATHAHHCKNDFLARMSHEFRTPLNAILGFSQLLEIEATGPGQRECAGQIIRAGRQLLEMVNEVLDLVRIDSGRLALTLEPISLHQLARETRDLLLPLAGERHVLLELQPGIEEHAPCVRADRQRLRQVMLNVLSNAILYNREGGKVTIGLGASGRAGRLRLEITDTGCGIASEKTARLFTPFERLGAEETEIEGDGIGLALSKRLMEAQGGDLGYEKLSEGSRFWIETPAADEPAAEDLALDLLRTVLDDAEPPLSPEPPPRDRPRTVLHIEDNESNRLLMKLLFLQRPTLHLVSATRGQEGLQLARDKRPDLILLDMHLPDGPGEEVLQHLRAEECTRSTPVVVISADASGPRIRHLREAGADDYLTKPFNVGQFFRMLDEHLMETR